MKMLLKAFLCSLALAPFAFAASAAAPAANQLLRNGTFENLLDSWSVEQHAPALADVTVTDDGPSGSRCVKIELVEAGDDHWKLGFAQHPLALRADKRYRVSFMAKADQQRWVAVGLMQHLAPYKVLAVNSSVEIGTEWSRVSVLLRPSADEVNGRFSIGNLGKIVGTVWLTEIKMIEE